MLRRVGAASLLVVITLCVIYEATTIAQALVEKPRLHAPAPGGSAARSAPTDVHSASRIEMSPEVTLPAAARPKPAVAQAPAFDQLTAWPQEAPCNRQTTAELSRARERIRATFVRVDAPPGSASLYFDPNVPDASVQRLLYALARIDGLIDLRLGLSSAAPDVYLYTSAAQLREGVCVSPKTVSCYDGAIHLELDANDDLLKSLKHEYTHHALFSHGIRRPVWFQEGAAMLMEDETEWSHWRPKAPLLRTDQMVQTFPQAVSAEAAEAFYGQAFAMTVFIGKLCEHRASCSLRELVRALSTGAVRPENLFDWAISQRGSDLVSTAHLPLWDDYAANGMRLGPDTAMAIAARR